MADELIKKVLEHEDWYLHGDAFCLLLHIPQVHFSFTLPHSDMKLEVDLDGQLFLCGSA